MLNQLEDWAILWPWAFLRFHRIQKGDSTMLRHSLLTEINKNRNRSLCICLGDQLYWDAYKLSIAYYKTYGIITTSIRVSFLRFPRTKLIVSGPFTIAFSPNNAPEAILIYNTALVLAALKWDPGNNWLFILWFRYSLYFLPQRKGWSFRYFIRTKQVCRPNPDSLLCQQETQRHKNTETQNLNN